MIPRPVPGHRNGADGHGLLKDEAPLPLLATDLTCLSFRLSMGQCLVQKLSFRSYRCHRLVVPFDDVNVGEFVFLS
jgi:hypothetical protein